MNNHSQQRKASFDALASFSAELATASTDEYNPSRPELPPNVSVHPQSTAAATSAAQPQIPYLDPQWLASTLQQVAPLLNSIPQPHSALSPLAASARERSPELDQTSRSRSLSPGPEMTLSPKQSQPSSEYIAQCMQPSKSVDKPDPHHLLVLDLNGTLLVRLKKSSATGRRVVRPRPYLRAFLRYLFDPDPEQQTSLWQVMVWSSAQPGNVNDMVQHAFGCYRERLVAVWARDTLGLSAADYHRKVQTTKDLAKIWNNIPVPNQHIYSPINTILLDDSALKAHLQPHNHLPLLEYTLDLHQQDESRHQRPLRKKGKKGKALAQPESSLSAGPPDGPDNQLLAIIGVLDTVAHQSSACGWIRAGGLWTGRDRARRAATAEILQKKLEAEIRQASQGQATSASSSTPADNASDSKKREDELREKLRLSLLRKRGTPSSSAVDMGNADDENSDKEVEDMLDLSADEGTGTGDPIPGNSTEIWYEDPVNLQYWVDKGVEVLTRRGIAVLPEGGEDDGNILPNSDFPGSSSARTVTPAAKQNESGFVPDAVQNKIINGQNALAEPLSTAARYSSMTREVSPPPISPPGADIQIPYGEMTGTGSLPDSSQSSVAAYNHPNARKDSRQPRGRRGRGAQDRGRGSYGGSRGRGPYAEAGQRESSHRERDRYDRDRDQESPYYRDSAERSHVRWDYEGSYMQASYRRTAEDYSPYSSSGRDHYAASSARDEFGRDIERHYERHVPHESHAPDLWRYGGGGAYPAYPPFGPIYEPRDPYWQGDDAHGGRRPYY